MTALWSFFVHEMRRNLPVLPVGLVAVGILALPAVRRLGQDVGVEDWRLLAAVCVLALLVPALAVYMASNAWLRERSEGTLRWLYARPLSSGALFAVRIAAMAVSLALFAAVGLGVLGVSPLAVVSDPSLLDLGVAPLLALLATLVPAAAVWASACAPRQGWGGPLLFAAVAAAWLLPAVVPGMLPVPAFLFEHRWELEMGMAVLRYLAFPLLLLAAAYWGTRRAVSDRRPRRQAVLASLVAAVVATAALVLAAHASVWIDASRVTLVRSLAEGRTLRYVEGRGLLSGVARVEVTGVGRLPLYSASPPFVAPDGRTALVPAIDRLGHRVLVSHDGVVRELPEIGAPPVGWSPSGERVAFLCRAGSRTAGALCDGMARTSLIVARRDGGVDVVPLPGLDAGGPWRAAWVDEDHVLLAEPRRAGGAEEGGGQRWGVVSIARRPARWVRPVEALPEGRKLTTAYAVSRGLLQGYPVPRRDGQLLLWLDAEDRRTLVALDPDDWSLEPLAVRPRGGMRLAKFHHAESLGTLDDGTAVWVERTAGHASGEHRVMALPPASGATAPEVRRSCRLPAEPRPDRFLGQVGRRAVWSGGGRLVFCHLDGDMGEVGEDLGLGPFGVLSVDVSERGVLVPAGAGGNSTGGMS